MAQFRELARDEFAAIPRDLFWFTAIALLGETCALIGDTEQAPVLYRLLEPHSEKLVQITQAASLGSAHRFLALLSAAMGDLARAEEHFERGLERNAACGLRPVVALMRREYAEMLMARGDTERARALLQETLREAEAGGMSQLISRVRVRLDEIDRRIDGTASATGVRRAPPRRGGPRARRRPSARRGRRARAPGPRARPGEVGAQPFADAPAGLADRPRGRERVARERLLARSARAAVAASIPSRGSASPTGQSLPSVSGAPASSRSRMRKARAARSGPSRSFQFGPTRVQVHGLHRRRARRSARRRCTRSSGSVSRCSSRCPRPPARA